MFTAPIQNALLFSISTIFTLYISIVLFRFLLQLVRADFYNPVAQFAVKATNPLLVPIRKFIPGFAGIDWASLVLALILQALALYLTFLVRGFSITPTASSIGGLFIWSFGEIIDIGLVLLMFAIFLQILASWIQPRQYNPITLISAQLTAPLFAPIRRIMPDTGMLDLSPMVLIFLIILSRILIVDLLINLGKSII